MRKCEVEIALETLFYLETSAEETRIQQGAELQKKQIASEEMRLYIDCFRTKKKKE